MSNVIDITDYVNDTTPKAPAITTKRSDIEKLSTAHQEMLHALWFLEGAPLVDEVDNAIEHVVLAINVLEDFVE